MGDLPDIALWALAAGALVLAVVGALFYAPAKTSILVDTAGSTARAEMRLLWGMGPKITARALPRESGGTPLALFNDAARIGHALMTPGIADAGFELVRRLHQLNPRALRAELAVNLPDTAQNTVVQTAVQAAIASAPTALRDAISVRKCEPPGAELTASAELLASPMQLRSIWNAFKNSRSTREFRKRLKRKPKPQKKAPREVRAA